MLHHVRNFFFSSASSQSILLLVVTNINAFLQAGPLDRLHLHKHIINTYITIIA